MKVCYVLVMKPCITLFLSFLLFTMESKQSRCQCHVHGLLNYYMDVIMLCLDVILHALLLILHGDGMLRNLLGSMGMHMRVV